MTVERLFAGGHSQVQITRTGPHDGMLRIKAFVARDELNRPAPRYVTFPVKLHRDFPPDAFIKDVSVSIRKIGTDWRYSVTFTCRAPATNEPDAGRGASGVNIGWKQVAGGLRAATAVHSDGASEHLLLPAAWIARMGRVRDLQGRLDEAVNEILPRLKAAIDPLPLWQEEGPAVEGYPEFLHRWLSSVKRAPKMSAQRLLELFLAIRSRMQEEPNALPLLHGIAEELESWRRENKRCWLEMVHLRDKLLAQRQDIYRVFAKRLADRSGLVVLDNTSYREAAAVKRPDGIDPTLHEQARANRVLAAPFELRLAIEQAQQKRGGHVERYAERINVCHDCGSANVSGDTVRTCHDCGATFDVDENAARNLLRHAIA